MVEGTPPVQADNSDAMFIGDGGISADSALMTVLSVQHEELVVLTVQGSIDILTAPKHCPKPLTRH